jgi:hypothetical protein
MSEAPRERSKEDEKREARCEMTKGRDKATERGGGGCRGPHRAPRVGSRISAAQEPQGRCRTPRKEDEHPRLLWLSPLLWELAPTPAQPAPACTSACPSSSSISSTPGAHSASAPRAIAFVSSGHPAPKRFPPAPTVSRPPSPRRSAQSLSGSSNDFVFLPFALRTLFCLACMDTHDTPRRNE